jgi:MFS family permease
MSVGFIAWAIGGVVGSLPAGFIGVRLGRRNAMLGGLALMTASFLALDRVTGLGSATVFLALASAAWTLPAVNAYPLFIEPAPPERRGILAALFVLCMALGGGIGDPLNGALFDLQGGYRSLFLNLAGYSAAAFVAVLLVPRGAGEAETAPGPVSSPPASLVDLQSDPVGKPVQEPGLAEPQPSAESGLRASLAPNRSAGRLPARPKN